MNNTPKRKRALGAMIRSSMSSYEIEMLVSAGKKMGVTTTVEAAKAELALDLHDFKSGVEKALGGAPTTQNQFDALVIFAYNVGIANFSTSSVLRNHRKGDFESAAKSFALWNKITVKGVKVHSKGLSNRRAKEVEIYLHSKY